jgi:hypothetical protein
VFCGHLVQLTRPAKSTSFMAPVGHVHERPAHSIRHTESERGNAFGTYRLLTGFEDHRTGSSLGSLQSTLGQQGTSRPETHPAQQSFFGFVKSRKRRLRQTLARTLAAEIDVAALRSKATRSGAHRQAIRCRPLWTSMDLDLVFGPRLLTTHH